MVSSISNPSTSSGPALNKVRGQVLRSSILRQAQDKFCNIVVVGAGIIGASIAYHLSRRRDVSVTVLERDLPGRGASEHSFAWLNSFGKNPEAYHHFNRRSIDAWERFARRLNADIELHWGGELRWECREDRADGLRRRIQQLQTWGYPIRPISLEELREMEPGISLDEIIIVSYSEIDGHVQPSKVIEACLRRACERGTVVYTETPVTRLRRDKKGCVEAVNTPKGEIPCDVVVLAGGVDTTALAATAGVHIPQEESPGVVIRVAPEKRILHTVSVLHLPPIDEERPEIHLRQLADGALQIGEGTQESLSRDNSQAHADDLLRRANHYLPDLAGAKAIPAPVGYRPMPTDGLPVIGFTEATPNLYIALMHSGVTLAPLVGELAALEIADGARVNLLDWYRPERFRR
jgi:glycine/D-amino acid oxidase-like deaminating enzyme